jgi:GH24 family phage-related lysozyme (muramidase)
MTSPVATSDLLAFLIAHEGFLRRPYWPGGQSGVTIGYGFDMGYHTRDQLEADWSGLPGEYLLVLLSCLGKVGLPASRLAKKPEVQAVTIGAAQAAEVLNRGLPVLEARVATTFPGVTALPRPAQVALCSLVFNRGASLYDPPGSDRRLEMRQIRDETRVGDLRGIAASLRSMKRLWVGTGQDGLLRRREDEAALVDSCLT